jgi:hypothetical protein
MKEARRLIQVYEVSDALVQEAIFGFLAAVKSLTVQATRSGRDTFLVVECSGDEQAWAIHRFVTSADSSAVLLHSSCREADPLRREGATVASLWK